MKKIKKLIDRTVRIVLSLNETKRNETKRNETKRTTICSKIENWKEVQLFSNCTFYVRKESEGLDLCSLFDLKNRGAFLC